MVHMAAHIRMLPLTPQATLPQTTTVWLWGSWLKAPLHMAGCRLALVTTVQAAILIGQTGHTVTSLLA